MAWKNFAQIALGGAIVFAQLVVKPHATPITQSIRFDVEEILSYDCARNIASVVNSNDQIGPLFTDGQLVFTSLEAQDLSKILLVNAGYGNFAVKLEDSGVNRIRFEIPTATGGEVKAFYMSYLHGGSLRSRYFEYSEERPPIGKDELDYALVKATRADNLLPHLDYAIHETAEATLNALAAGRILRKQLVQNKLEGCEHIARESPGLSKNLRHNLDILAEIMAMPGSGRVPASLAGH